MIARSARRRIGNDNTWPGFVDALSTLLLVIIFLLSVFVLAQFFLGQALSGRDEALVKLRDQVAELANLLRLEQAANAELRMSVGQLSASLQTANLDRDELSSRVRDLQGCRRPARPVPMPSPRSPSSSPVTTPRRANSTRSAGSRAKLSPKWTGSIAESGRFSNSSHGWKRRLTPRKPRTGSSRR